VELFVSVGDLQGKCSNQPLTDICVVTGPAKCRRNAFRTLSSPPKTVRLALPASPKRTNKQQLFELRSSHQRYAANSSPATQVRGAFSINNHLA
jgi:hypothetical protein